MITEFSPKFASINRGGSGVCFEETETVGDLRLVMGMCWDVSRQQVVVVIMLMDSMGSAQWGVGVCLEETGTVGDLRLVIGMCWYSSRQQVVVVIMSKDSMGIMCAHWR